MFNFQLLSRRRRIQAFKRSFLTNQLQEILVSREECLKNKPQKIQRTHLDDFGDFSKQNAFDLISSFMMMHWVDDPQNYCKRAYDTLIEEGCFQGCFLGGGSFKDLNLLFMQTELELYQKTKMRFHPLISAPSFSNILLESGFCDVVIDIEEIELSYESLDDIIKDIRETGETYALKASPSHFFPKMLYKEIKTRYNERSFPIQLDIIYWTTFKRKK